MENRTLHPQLIEFIAILEYLENVLTEYETFFWAKKIARVKEIAEKSDGYCIEQFFDLFGGMGSLNDLVLNAPASVNDKLRKQLSRANNLASELRQTLRLANERLQSPQSRPTF